jgi:hypothetical protein
VRPWGASLRDLSPDAWLRDARRLLAQHRQRVGRHANPLLPRSFNEHVLHRLLFARAPLHRVLNDKLAMRRFVEERAGPGHTVPLLHVTADPGDIPWERLPPAIVLKASHGSGWVRAVAATADTDRAALAAEVRDWLGRNYYEESREWGYRHAAPLLLVEPLIAAEPLEAAPRDHKLFVFRGRIACVQMRRFSAAGRLTAAIFDAQGRRLAMRYNGLDDDAVPPPAPDALRQLAALAARIGAGLDFIRLDAFHDPGTGRILINEITTYPNAGCGRFEPHAADLWLGACWRAAARGARFPEPVF